MSKKSEGFAPQKIRNGLYGFCTNRENCLILGSKDDKSKSWVLTLYHIGTNIEFFVTRTAAGKGFAFPQLRKSARGLFDRYFEVFSKFSQHPKMPPGFENLKWKETKDGDLVARRGVADSMIHLLATKHMPKSWSADTWMNRVYVSPQSGGHVTDRIQCVWAKDIFNDEQAQKNAVKMAGLLLAYRRKDIGGKSTHK